MLYNIATSSFVCVTWYHEAYMIWYVIRPKIWPIPCSMNRYFNAAFYTGIFLFPRHCIFHFAILKRLSPPWGSICVINVNQNYRAGNMWTLDQKCKMQLNKNWPHSAKYVKLNKCIYAAKLHQLIEIVTMCTAYRLFVVVEMGYEVFELLWKKFRNVFK